jgi:DNA-binding transcriptional MerR regulator
MSDEKRFHSIKDTEQKIISEATEDRDLVSSDIPGIDLYLDQILGLVCDKNAEAGEVYRDRNLTKMMVNNYAKAGLIAPPNGKKYTKKHIVEMLLVNNLKNTLSLSKIKQTFDGMDIETIPADRLSSLYDSMIEDKASVKGRFGGIAEEIFDFGTETEEETLRTLFSLCAYSLYFREAANLLIDSCFPAVDARVEKKQKKEKSEKGDKAEKAKKAEPEITTKNEA